MVKLTRVTKTIKSFTQMFMAAVIILCAGGALLALPAKAATNWQVSLQVHQITAYHEAISQVSAFTYLLRPVSANAPMPIGSTPEGYLFTITGTNGTFISQLTFTSPGVYTYELQVIDGSDYFYTDQRVFTIEVYVMENLDSVSVVYTGEGAKMPDLSFVHTGRNRPQPPTPETTEDADHVDHEIYEASITMASLTIVKTVDGAPPTPAVFTFALVAEDMENPMPAGSANGVKKLSIIGQGQAPLGTWRYDTPGIYRYTVYEINTGIEGYTYDPNIYTITDHVQAAGDTYTVTRTITNSAGHSAQVLASEAVLEFINIYTAPDTGLTAQGGGTDTSPPGEGGRHGGGYSPRTGDFSNPNLWISIIVVAGALLILLLFFGVKHNRRHSV